MVNVIGLAVQDNGEMKPVEEAANRVTGVKIYDIAGREKVVKYAGELEQDRKSREYPNSGE